MPESQNISKILVLAAAFGLAGCAGSVTDAGLPAGPAAYSVIPTKGIEAPTAYLIQPADILDLRVFKEEDISNPKLRVDSVGNIQIPFAGQIKASGRSTQDVQQEITSKLAARYLVNPQVTLSVAEPAPRYVAVEGEVGKPGVYEMGDNFTLLSAIARAESTTSVAKLNEVIVLRTIDGQQMAARFNLRDIRGGAAPDPLILNNDVVIVGHSGSRQALENFLKMGGFFSGIFYLIR